MKKSLLFVASILAGLSSFSQITISSSNLASIGDQTINSNDTVSSITITAAGPSQTWNYPSLLDHERDTIDFVDPATTPNGSNFPSSNLALSFGSSGTYGYFSKTASVMDIVGGSLGNINATYSNNQTLAVFPVTYGNTNTDTYASQAKGTGAEFGEPAADSIRVNITGTSYSTVDAWGTLTTPMGTFNVLRSNDTTYETTVIEGKAAPFPWTVVNTQIDTTYSHSFYTNDANSKWILLSYNLDNTGAKDGGVEWARVTPASTSIVNNSTIDFNIYPNPTTDILNITGKSKIDAINVISLEGKAVMNVNNTNTVNVSNLTNGTYVISILSNKEVVNLTFTKE